MLNKPTRANARLAALKRLPLLGSDPEALSSPPRQKADLVCTRPQHPSCVQTQKGIATMNYNQPMPRRDVRPLRTDFPGKSRRNPLISRNLPPTPTPWTAPARRRFTSTSLLPQPPHTFQPFPILPHLSLGSPRSARKSISRQNASKTLDFTLIHAYSRLCLSMLLGGSRGHRHSHVPQRRTSSGP